MGNKQISVVIPCFNHGQFIREAIDSIEQFDTKKYFEIIIVNDGSTDKNTIETLQSLTSEGYTVINQVNKGLASARNAGIKIAQCNYILPLDSDNKIRPEIVLEAFKKMEADNSIDVVYSDAEYFGEKQGIWKVGNFNLQRLMISNYIDACALFRKSLWEKHNGYDEKMPAMGIEDWDFWLRIAFSNGNFHYLEKIMFDYRIISNSMIRSLTPENSAKLNEYLQIKHKAHLDREYLRETIFASMQAQKRSLFIHLFILNISPRLYRYLIKKKVLNKKYFI